MIAASRDLLDLRDASWWHFFSELQQVVPEGPLLMSSRVARPVTLAQEGT